VLRLGSKVYKKALRTSNLKKANIRKIRILQHFKDKFRMNNFTMSNDQLQVITIIEEDDDIEEAKKVISDINKTANQGVEQSEKLNKITTQTKEEIKYSTIEEEVNNFYKHYAKTNPDSEKRIKEFESTFKYLFLKFPKKTRLLYILEFEDWDNFRDFLIELPNKALRRYGTKKHGTDIQTIIENILTEDEENGEETTLLNTRTINKHFNIFGMFLSYLEMTKKIPSNPIRYMKELKEIANPYKNFTEDDIVKIFMNTKDEQIKNFYSVALYTGLRLSAIISIKAEDIDLTTNKLNITKDKTTNGIRTIVIHKKLRPFFKEFVESGREHLFFGIDNKDKIQKMINPIIADILQERKTIHGFRKSFTIELYKATDDNNLRKYIVGHSQKSDLTFTIYNLENMDFEKMETAINKVNFPIVSVPKTKEVMLNM
jgi:integrase